jgi:hypothetical protein
MAGAPGNVPANAAVRNLTLEDTQVLTGDRQTATSSAAITLQPGEVRGLVALIGKDGEVQGWVETKRTADDIEDSITVDTTGGFRKRRATDVSYPRVGASGSNSRPHVTFADDDEDIAIEDVEDDVEDETLAGDIEPPV